jgi:hypothetical protein
MNGIPIAGTKLLGGAPANFNTQHTFIGLNVTGMVGGGANTLSIFVQNLGLASGIVFSATLTVTTTPTLCEYFPQANPSSGGWTRVPMSGGVPPDYRNDDGSSGPIALPFGFCFYGTTYSAIYINNNGNVTLTGPSGAAVPVAFPVAGIPRIAPFWADVDTRNPSSGVVWMLVSPTRIAITWDRVGYYNQHADKRNTFQLLLSNGTDGLVGLGQNVCFCYGDMQWTTGDVSGTSGFGGSPAIAGINVGDGANAVQVGRFDQAGSAYDGPLGANDGVDWLDCRRLCFDTCGCGQHGQVGLNDLTINGSYSQSGSGLQINVPTPSIVTVQVSAPPGSLVTLMFSLDCDCPGLATPFGSFHLNPTSLAPIVDGCGVFGPPNGAGFVPANGVWTFTAAIPAGVNFCFCMQALVCTPVGFFLTQSYRVCFI